MMCMAPRGIVAAGVASVFALRLLDMGYQDAALLVPVTFLVILVTVTFYGLAAFPVARKLGISQPNPQGLLIVGAHAWARQMAGALKVRGYPILMVDTDWVNLATARKEGLRTLHASIVSEYALDKMDLTGIGRLLALTSNREANSLAALHFAPVLGRANVYQLAPGGHKGSRTDSVSQDLRGRFLFGSDVTFTYLTGRFSQGAEIKATKLTERFDFSDFLDHYGETALPLFIMNRDHRLTIITTETRLKPTAGQTLISVVGPSFDDFYDHLTEVDIEEDESSAASDAE